MARSQKELAIQFFNDVLQLEIVADILEELDDEECLDFAREKIDGYLGEAKLQEFETYLLNGN